MYTPLKGQSLYWTAKGRLGIYIGLLLSLLVVTAAAFFIPRYFTRQTAVTGVILKPSRDIPVHSVVYYLQNDPAWSHDKIGNSNSSLGGYGCLVACVSSSLTYMGYPVNPKELNAQMTAVGGFQNDILLWGKIALLYPDISYKYGGYFSSATIENDLRAGRLPIVNVRYKGSGITHWLLIIGAQDGEFLVYDPLNADKQPMKLSEHGKVYAYRLLSPR